ncbi:MAG: hypothetical protein ACFB2Z_02790 [Maricaulaceae bacterium]
MMQCRLVRFLSRLAPAWLVSAPLALSAEPPIEGPVATVRLDAVAGKDNALLDWAAPAFETRFALPPGRRVDALTLELTAAPVGAQTAPPDLLVWVNDDPPVRLELEDYAFKARLQLDPAALRSGAERIGVGLTPGSDCPGPKSGGWRIDLTQTRLRAQWSPAQGVSDYADILAALEADVGAPRRIHLDIVDTDPQSAVALGALIAQGLALRLGRPPEFVDAETAQLHVLAGSAEAFADRGAPVEGLEGPTLAADFDARLIIAGRTREEALAAAQRFAAKARAPVAVDLAQTWRPEPWRMIERLPADVETAELALAIRRGPDASPGSTVAIQVNGHSMGEITLWREVTPARIRLPASVAQAGDNVITLAPRLQPRRGESVCRTSDDAALASLETLTLSPKSHKPTSGLARFARAAAPFAAEHGAQTAIALALEDPQTRNAGFAVIARLAMEAGAALDQAWYGAALLDAPANRNLLLISSRDALDPTLAGAAPSGFAPGRGAFPTRPSPRFWRSTPRAFAAEPLGPIGVAAWFTSPFADDRETVVITADVDADLSIALNDLAYGRAWSRLDGAVARWSGDETAISAADISLTAPRQWITRRWIAIALGALAVLAGGVSIVQTVLMAREDITARRASRLRNA